MIKTLAIALIPGIMVGMELDYINGFLVIDLGIIRIVYDYRGFKV